MMQLTPFHEAEVMESCGRIKNVRIDIIVRSEFPALRNDVPRMLLPMRGIERNITRNDFVFNILL